MDIVWKAQQKLEFHFINYFCGVNQGKCIKLIANQNLKITLWNYLKLIIMIWLAKNIHTRHLAMFSIWGTQRRAPSNPITLISVNCSPSIFVDSRQMTTRSWYATDQAVWRLCQRCFKNPDKIVWRISTGVSCDGSRPENQPSQRLNTKEHLNKRYHSWAEAEDSISHQAVH